VPCAAALPRFAPRTDGPFTTKLKENSMDIDNTKLRGDECTSALARKTRSRHAIRHRLLVAGLLPLLSFSSACTNGGPSTEDHTGSLSQGALGEPVNTNPTGYWWYYGQTPSQVSTLLSNNNARLVSIQVESTSPFLLTVAMVQNTGTYAKKWYWYVGENASQVNQLTSSLNARIADLDAYAINGTTNFAVILLDNTGSDATQWWWYYGLTSINQIASELSNHNAANPIRIHQYTEQGVNQYAVVMYARGGAYPAGSWWYTDVSASQVNSFLQQNNAYLIDLEPTDPSGTAFNVIMNPNPGLQSYWYYGQTASTLPGTFSTNNARPFDLKTYFNNGQREFTVIEIQNH
jgi:hypothetical protein